MKEILYKVLNGKKLNEFEVSTIVEKINNKTAEPMQIAALLGAISAKKGGIDAQELAYFAKSVRKTSKHLNLKTSKPLIDVCGTGGDCLSTFNISTAVSFIVVSCNLGVVKHGARSVSSICGSADVLEELGVNLNFDKQKAQNIFDKTSMLFLYAPNYNSTMAKIKDIRNALKIPTLFNLLGPLVNPFKLDYQIIGVFDETKCELVANSLLHLGLKEAMVVHSCDGLDELSITSDNIIYHLKNGIVKKIQQPSLEEIGLKPAKLEDIKGSDAKFNANIILKILNNEEKGPKRDIVLLNSAAALFVAGIVKNFKEGVELSLSKIETKEALNVLERLKNVSR